jgi:hypothetical protein
VSYKYKVPKNAQEKHLSVWSVVSDERKKAQRTHPYTHLDLPSLNLQLVYLTYSSIPTSTIVKRKDILKKKGGCSERTRKSTPIVALASSSGNHCLSEKRNNRLLFPTEELPMRSNLTLMSSCDDRDCGVGAMMRGAWCVVRGVENVRD